MKAEMMDAFLSIWIKENQISFPKRYYFPKFSN